MTRPGGPFQLCPLEPPPLPEANLGDSKARPVLGQARRLGREEAHTFGAEAMEAGGVETPEKE